MHFKGGDEWRSEQSKDSNRSRRKDNGCSSDPILCLAPNFWTNPPPPYGQCSVTCMTAPEMKL